MLRIKIGEILESLRWKEDMIVINDFGERVWLKPCYNKHNKRIGITDCCFANDPCNWHKKIAESIKSLGN